jgi:hypothetical protein
MIRKAAAIYSIIVGISMFMMWIMFYLIGSIPELTTEPARIVLHIFAELAAAAALIAAGFGLLKLKAWSHQLYLLATGALIYTMIQSPGYFLQNGELGFVVMFAVLLILGLILLVNMIKDTIK